MQSDLYRCGLQCEFRENNVKSNRVDDVKKQKSLIPKNLVKAGKETAGPIQMRFSNSISLGVQLCTLKPDFKLLPQGVLFICLEAMALSSCFLIVVADEESPDLRSERQPGEATESDLQQGAETSHSSFVVHPERIKPTTAASKVGEKEEMNEQRGSEPAVAEGRASRGHPETAVGRFKAYREHETEDTDNRELGRDQHSGRVRYDEPSQQGEKTKNRGSGQFYRENDSADVTYGDNTFPSPLEQGRVAGSGSELNPYSGPASEGQEGGRQETINSHERQINGYRTFNVDGGAVNVNSALMQNLMSQQPQTFNSNARTPGLSEKGFTDRYKESDEGWLTHSGDHKVDFKINPSTESNYRLVSPNSKTGGGKFRNNYVELRGNDFYQPTKKGVQYSSVAPGISLNVGYTIGFSQQNPGSATPLINNAVHSHTKEVGSVFPRFSVHVAGMDTKWKQVQPGLEVSDNMLAVEHRLEPTTKSKGPRAGLFSPLNNHNLNSPRQPSAHDLTSAGRDTFDHDHALGQSNSFDITNAVDPVYIPRSHERMRFTKLNGQGIVARGINPSYQLSAHSLKLPYSQALLGGTNLVQPTADGSTMAVHRPEQSLLSPSSLLEPTYYANNFGLPAAPAVQHLFIPAAKGGQMIPVIVIPMSHGFNALPMLAGSFTSNHGNVYNPFPTQDQPEPVTSVAVQGAASSYSEQPSYQGFDPTRSLHSTLPPRLLPASTVKQPLRLPQIPIAPRTRIGFSRYNAESPSLTQVKEQKQTADASGFQTQSNIDVQPSLSYQIYDQQFLSKPVYYPHNKANHGSQVIFGHTVQKDEREPKNGRQDFDREQDTSGNNLFKDIFRQNNLRIVPGFPNYAPKPVVILRPSQGN